MTKIKRFDNLENLSRFAAEKFIEIGNDAIEKNDKFSVALAGGSTPKMLYKILTSDEVSAKIDWKKVFFFFGDERNVPTNSDKSNFRMANETLFQPLKISNKNIFRWETELEDVEKIAEDYAKKIDNFLPFDLILLGMGDDAHTASLFPDTEALKETKKIAVANFVEKFDSHRLTLTFSIINNSKNIIFLISGEKKAEALREVLQGEFQPEKFPSQKVKPENGNLLWLVDKAAAKLLDS